MKDIDKGQNKSIKIIIAVIAVVIIFVRHK